MLNTTPRTRNMPFTARTRHATLALGIAGALAACQGGPTSPTGRPCVQTESAYVRQEVPVTARSPPQALALFTLVEHFSRWEGNLDCALEHQYDRHSWVTISIKNLSELTVSFDYTITYLLERTVSGSVQGLAPGAVLETQPLCPPFGACGSPPYDPLAIEVGNISYAP